MYLDGSSVEFVTQPNKVYTVNLKAQGYVDDTNFVVRDMFGVFSTDGANVVQRLYRIHYAQDNQGTFVATDIDLNAGTGTIQVSVVGEPSPAVTNWTAFMWGVEMAKP
jgi:hypothetical protein